MVFASYLTRLCAVRCSSPCYSKMVPQRRLSARLGSSSKQFLTPLKNTAIGAAEIKRASAIFTESCPSSSDNNSDDNGIETYVRRRDPQLDSIRRKLNFNERVAGCATKSKSVSSTFRARKVRALDDKLLASRPTKVYGVEGKLKAVETGLINSETDSEIRKHHSPDRTTRRSKTMGKPVLTAVVKEEPDVDFRSGLVKSETPSGIVERPEGGTAAPVPELPKVVRTLRRRKLELEKGTTTSVVPRRNKKQMTNVDEFISRNDIKPVIHGQLAPGAVPLRFDMPYNGPYSEHSRPYPEECEAVRDLLRDLHGELPEYEHHRVSCPTMEHVQEIDQRDECGGASAQYSPETKPVVTFGGEEPPKSRRGRDTVLDALVGTLLSQNTTDQNSSRAFASLKRSFSSWDDVLRANPKEVEDAIRCGGLAETKAKRILEILRTLSEERGQLSLEYLRGMSNEEIKTELSRFKGVGPKTVACVLMFHLQREEFPVDTHVFRISKALGWVPAIADRRKPTFT